MCLCLETSVTRSITVYHFHKNEQNRAELSMRDRIVSNVRSFVFFLLSFCCLFVMLLTRHVSSLIYSKQKSVKYTLITHKKACVNKEVFFSGRRTEVFHTQRKKKPAPPERLKYQILIWIAVDELLASLKILLE